MKNRFAGKARKSKSPEQVSSGKTDKPEWFNRGVRLALLAPTAVNQQKFEIVLKEDDTVEFVDKGGVLSRVDLGIVRYHFELGPTELFAENAEKMGIDIGAIDTVVISHGREGIRNYERVVREGQA